MMNGAGNSASMFLCPRMSGVVAHATLDCCIPIQALGSLFVKLGCGSRHSFHLAMQECLRCCRESDTGMHSVPVTKKHVLMKAWLLGVLVPHLE